MAVSRAPRMMRLDPWLMTPDGEVIGQPVPVYPVYVSSGPRLIEVADVKGTPLTVLPPDLSHIINRHSSAAMAATLGRVAKGVSTREKYANVGYFFPEYSSPAGITELIGDVYNAVGPGQSVATKNGLFEVYAGALLLLETTTRATKPRLVGLAGLGGPPTNLVSLFIRKDNTVLTMFPCGPTVFFDANEA